MRTVNLYIESLRDVPLLSGAALRTHTKTAPAVAVRGGCPATGQRGALERCRCRLGVVRALRLHRGAPTPPGHRNTQDAHPHQSPHGHRVALATTLGSFAIIGDDATEAAGLAVPPLSATGIEARPYILPFIVPGNPLDFSNGYCPEKSA